MLQIFLAIAWVFCLQNILVEKRLPKEFVNKESKYKHIEFPGLKSDLPNVVVITAGGIIAQAPNESGALVPTLSGIELIKKKWID